MTLSRVCGSFTSKILNNSLKIFIELSFVIIVFFKKKRIDFCTINSAKHQQCKPKA